MSASHPSAYDIRGTKPSWRHWKRELKRRTARTMRRIGKQLLDMAPKRVTKGWAD